MTKNNDLNDEDLVAFCKMFGVSIDNTNRFLSKWDCSLFHQLTATDDAEFKKEQAIQLTISYVQLGQLIKILKSKGYFHDDDYQIKLSEEELIMSNPELKKLHDQYKMLLYLMNNRYYEEF